MVRLLEPRVIALTVEASDTISSIKGMIQNMENIQRSAFDLCMGDDVLQTTSTVGDYNIAPDTMLLSLRHI